MEQTHGTNPWNKSNVHAEHANNMPRCSNLSPSCDTVAINEANCTEHTPEARQKPKIYHVTNLVGTSGANDSLCYR